MKHLILILALLVLTSPALAEVVAVEEVQYPVEAWWASMDASYDGSRVVANFGGDIWLLDGGVWTHIGFGHELSSGVGISADGTAIISATNDPETGLRNPAIWYEANSWADPTLLGGIPGYDSCDNSVGSGYSLNYDGSIAVGLGWNACEGVAFMWTAATGMVDIGGVRASAISDDGTVVTGFDHAEWGGRRANKWNNNPDVLPPDGVDGPILLGDPDNAPSEGHDVTSDGSMIVGEHFPVDSGWNYGRAMIYTDESGVITLGTLGDNEWHRSIATMVSDDGKAVGVSGDPPPWGMWDVFIWDVANGMQQLKQVCLDAGVDLPEGFENKYLTGTLALSGNGSTLYVTWQDDMWNQGAYCIKFSTPVSIEGDDEIASELPGTVRLQQNYPNPFNPMTNIAFDLPRTEQVSVIVHDIKGRHIRTLHDGVAEAGHHVLMWDGTDSAGQSVPSGMYLYRLVTETRTYHRTMSLLK